MAYEHKRIEEKWRKRWKEEGTYRVENDLSKPKYYVLDMFPYPSGAGLHVGHPLGYIASDIVARHKRHQGFNVLHPMGYDSFGLPAEQYAIQTGQHPAKTTEVNIARYREQLDNIGFSFDWSREVRTSDPSYYRWTQWIFLQLFDSWYDHAVQKARPIAELIERFEQQGWNGQDDSALTGNEELEPLAEFSRTDWATFPERHKQSILLRFRLAYLSEAWVNWCPALGTVLANDEVKDGVSERGGHPVERKRMPQWSMRITAYAQRLLDGLDGLDWSESIKESQRNWIGRSEGALISFKVKDSDLQVDVFTTRPDTIFGVSFVTLAPEHELITQITPPERMDEVMAYVTQAKNRSERERMTEVKRVSGVFTGAYVKHPFTHMDVPVWVGDYVLGGYGTGAVMGVPAHDQRDFAFATHFQLRKIQVIEYAPQAASKAHYGSGDGRGDGFLGDGSGGGHGDGISPFDEHRWQEWYGNKSIGVCINSGKFVGLAFKQAFEAIVAELESLGVGERRINFRLRDAAFGRQRYWGEPIPIYYQDGTPYPVEEKHLPLLLPEVDKFLPTEDGEPPLARAKDWSYNPMHGRVANGEGAYPLETTTMPGWAGSSWYFLRYMDPKNEGRFASPEAINYWQQVDLYVGGSEHATGHLLYFRFWTKFLKDRGWINFDEPAKKLVNQGMIQGVSARMQRIDVGVGTENPISELTLPQVFVSSELRHELLSQDVKVQFDAVKFVDQVLQDASSVLERRAGVKGIRLRSVMGVGNHFSGTLIPIDTLFKDEQGRFGNDETRVDLESLRQARPFLETAVFVSRGKDFHCWRELDKMSKSKFNVVNPDDIIEKNGADTLRLYEMFLGPIEQSKPWDTNGIEGTSRFLKKFWNLFHDDAIRDQGSAMGSEGFRVSDDAPTKAELKVLHATLKKVTEDIEKLSFNTSVSQFMIACNGLHELKCHKRAVLEPLTIALAPFAPHIAEELWGVDKLGHATSITLAPWPKWDASHLEENSFSYPISFNGKTRLQLEFPIALDAQGVEAAVLANPEVQARLEGKAPKKVIVVPKRIVNIVM